MNKKDVQNFITSDRARDLIKMKVAANTDKNWILVLGRLYEGMGEINDEDDMWIPLAILKNNLLEIRHDGTVESQGGVRLIDKDGMAEESGFAFMGAHDNNRAGIWFWSDR